jgi:hypothetical protein
VLIDEQLMIDFKITLHGEHILSKSNSIVVEFWGISYIYIFIDIENIYKNRGLQESFVKNLSKHKF